MILLILQMREHSCRKSLVTPLKPIMMRHMLQKLSKIWIATFLVAALAVSVVSVHEAQARSNGIAAVVNNRAITFSDVNDRVDLILRASGLPDNKEARSRFEPQVLDMLIDEQIKMQEANRLGITVSEEEKQAGLATLAQQNNITAEQFTGMIKQSGLKLSTLFDQIEAEVAWGKVVASQVRPRVQISDADIDAEMARLEQTIGAQQYLVSEIFLSVANPDEEARVRQSAQKIYQQVKQSPEKFGALAVQFSQAGAEKGGDMGWVQGVQVEKEIENALKQMGNGSISSPVRSATGYHILLLRNTRVLDQAGLPDREAVMQSIGNKRLSRQARGYLQDLKSTAFIETRV